MPTPETPDDPQAATAQLTGTYWLDTPPHASDADECTWCAQLRNTHTPNTGTLQSALPQQQPG